MGFGVWGLGFGVWGLGFGVWGLGIWVAARTVFRFRNEGSLFGVLMLRMPCYTYVYIYIYIL